MNKHFSEEDLQMANKNVKKCLTSLTIREIQIKTTIRYYIHIKMTKIKYSHNTSNASEDAKKLGYSYTASGNVKWHSYSKKQNGSF